MKWIELIYGSLIHHTPPHGRQHFWPIWMKNHCNRSGRLSTSFCSGIDSVNGSSGGKCLWNASTAAATPSSFSSTFASSITRDFTWKDHDSCPMIQFLSSIDKDEISLVRDIKVRESFGGLISFSTKGKALSFLDQLKAVRFGFSMVTLVLR